MSGGTRGGIGSEGRGATSVGGLRAAASGSLAGLGGAAASGRRRARGEGARTGARVPPQDLEAERAVLSALLLDNQALPAVYIEVKPEDFYHPAHQVLYREMIDLSERGEPVDLHTLSDALVQAGRLDEVGGAAYLAEISDYEATAANVLHHARIVRDKAVKRHLIQVSSEVAELAYEQAAPAQELLDVAQARVFELGQARARDPFRSLGDEMQSVFTYVEDLMRRGGGLTGLPTGFRDLDELTGGLQRGDLIILAARPSMGKTALALNLARNVTVDHGGRALFFSLEMTTRSLVLRLLSAEARVDQSLFRRGHISRSDYARLVDAAQRLDRARLLIDDTGDATVLEMKAKARRAQSDGGLDLVVVDYLQLARGEGRAERREQEISEISRGLKSLAKELDIPVIALSQLNRGPETRPANSKRPMLADLRESGAIEQDADVIAFIYRDEVYNRDTEDKGIAELIVAKQRNGPTETVKLHFEARYNRFTDLSPRDDAPPPVRSYPPTDDLDPEAEPPF